MILITIGLVSSVVTGLIQLRQLGFAIPPDQYLQPPLMLGMVVAIAVVAWRGRHAGRASLIDGYAGAVFVVAASVAMVLNVTAQDRVISPAGMALVWAAAFSMALLINGAIGRSGPLFGGGLAMLAATAAASVVPGWLPGLLSQCILLAPRIAQTKTAAYLRTRPSLQSRAAPLTAAAR